jgi:hypothetical protein
MFELVKSALQKTSLYPAAKELYRVTWKRSFISNRKRLTDFYRPLVPKNAIVFDVGANRGEFADAFLRLEATVYAVEPHPTCTKELKALYGHDRKFNLVDCALGSAPGEALLYLGENGMDNVSTLSEDYRRDAKRSPGLAVGGMESEHPRSSRHARPPRRSIRHSRLLSTSKATRSKCCVAFISRCRS